MTIYRNRSKCQSANEGSFSTHSNFLGSQFVICGFKLLFLCNRNPSVSITFFKSNYNSSFGSHTVSMIVPNVINMRPTVVETFTKNHKCHPDIFHSVQRALTLYAFAHVFSQHFTKEIWQFCKLAFYECGCIFCFVAHFVSLVHSDFL